MPLKPIFDRAPLMALADLPLRPGQARAASPKLQRLYTLCQAEIAGRPSLWEGTFRLACLLNAHPEAEPVAEIIRSALERQAEDGSFPGGVAESVALLRAAWAMYEHEAKRPLLERLTRWCGWACEHWETVLADAAVRVSPADLMALLEDIYRVTGQKALLHLCDRLRAGGMDWSGALHTFSAQRPMARTVPWAELSRGLDAEHGDETGYFTRLYLTCHGETLADGARASLMCGLFSGSGTELSAPRDGWEKIVRYHGAVCGGVTSDETLAGASPSKAIDAAALGTWAEAFAAVREPWAWDALDTLFHNGLPACVGESGLIPLQRVNGLAADCGGADCYHLRDGQPLRALDRLARGYSAALHAAMTLRPDGPSVNLYVPGRYALPVGEQALMLAIAGNGDNWTITVHAKTPVQTALRLRVPDWSDGAVVTVNGESIAEEAENGILVLRRAWREGDVIAVHFASKLRVLDGYHQSACVMLGHQVMAYPATEKDAWRVALVGAPSLQADGTVAVPLAAVSSWRQDGPVPADLPVRPETAGEPFSAVLSPYAETPCRIALFPRGKRA